jgi:hypothetical protein
MHLLFSLAFLSGVHGFAIFAPYLLAVVTIGHMRRLRQGAVKAVAKCGAQEAWEIRSEAAVATA